MATKNRLARGPNAPLDAPRHRSGESGGCRGAIADAAIRRERALAYGATVDATYARPEGAAEARGLADRCPAVAGEAAKRPRIVDRYPDLSGRRLVPVAQASVVIAFCRRSLVLSLAVALTLRVAPWLSARPQASPRR